MLTITKSRTQATSEATADVARIAEIQREIARILDAAAASVEPLEIEMAARAESMRNLISRKGADAKKVADAIEANQVRCGDLSSRAVDVVTLHSGRSMYPEQYRCFQRKWSIVENNF